MKKFFAILFFLLLIGGIGFLFYRGWTQFRVKAGECGIVISKISGVLDEPVESGKFSWHWEFLLPTNARLISFSLNERQITKNFSGELPSAKLFSSAWKGESDFSYSYDFSCSAKVSPKNLVQLVKDGKIENEETLQAYVERECLSIGEKAVSFILYEASEKNIQTVFSKDDFFSNLKIADETKFIEIENCTVKVLKQADMSLYKAARENFLESQKLETKMKEKNERVTNLLDELKKEFQNKDDE